MTQLNRLLRVRCAEVFHEHWVSIDFDNGSTRDVDLEPYLRGPIFAQIRRDNELFRNFHIEGGTICWPNGADIDPDVLYYDLVPEQLPDHELTSS